MRIIKIISLYSNKFQSNLNPSLGFLSLDLVQAYAIVLFIF